MTGYRAKYDQRGPNSSIINNDGERYQLTEEHGMTYIDGAPMKDVTLGHPPRSHQENSTSKSKYIWVITEKEVPAILELSEKAKFLPSKRATHTNLTGGGLAYCGGEVWFESGERIYVSGSSGRYPPRSIGELQDICLAFIQLGYSVTSFGWNDDTNRPHRYFRG